MMKNKEFFIKTLMEKTNRSEADCIIINYVLENHFIIGRNNKEKIINDFMEKLSIEYDEADKLYNTCMEEIVKNSFKRNK